MECNFEYLELLPRIESRIERIELSIENKIEKRWLNINEASEYIGYKKDAIHKKVQNGEFQRGIHYHKESGKLLFDKNELDNWVMGISTLKTSTDVIVNNIMENVVIAS